MSGTVNFKYRAFLSYAHADVRWAKWLHGRLEGFRIDKDLAGRVTPRGPVPKFLRPIFRDREDFSGGHSLTNATIEALDDSAALIVLCSTVSATRPAVNEEVRLYRSRHPERPVIPVIIGGTYPDNFPAALRFEIAADGTSTDRPMTILGPDLRETADGRQLGLAKIVAGLTGVGTDDIVRRADRARQRQLRNWIGGLSAVVVALTCLSVWAEVNRREAVSQRSRAEEQRLLAEQRRAQAERNFALAKGAADALVFDIVQGLRDVEGMRAESVAKILGTTRGTIDKLTDAAPNSLELQRSRAAMLTEFGDTYVAQGTLPEALSSFRDSLAILERLAKADPGNSEWQRDLSVTYDRVGDVLAAQGNLPGALASFHDSLAIRDHLANAEPSNTDWQHNLSISYIKVSEILLSQGNAPDALKSRRESLAIMERLAKANPDKVEWQRDLSVTYERVGDVLRGQGNFPEALQTYRDSLTVRDRLAKLDSGNGGRQRDLSVAYEKVGDVLRGQGDLRQALQSYRDSLAIADRLARADSGNAGWQRDLAVAHNKVGDVLVELGDFLEALQSYHEGLAIRERLAKIDPSNGGWQRDLSVSYVKLGGVHARMGNFVEALKVAENLALLAEKVEVAATGAPGLKTAQRLGELAWYALLANQPSKALTAAERAHSLAPNLVWLETNRAHALLLLERFNEARVVYLAHKGQAVEGDKPWEQLVTEDFSKLRSAGVSHPAMAEIEATLADK